MNAIVRDDFFRVICENPNNDLYEIKDFDPQNNQIIEGDNLHSLSALTNQEFDVIYIDPPYNTGKNTFRYGDQNNNWVSFIYNRLVIAKTLMTARSSIFISIDDNEYHTLRFVTDAVFGSKNFVANFIWRKSHTVKNDKVGISTQHEYVLCYARDITKVHFNREATGDTYIDKAYRYRDGVGRYRVVPLHKAKNKKSFTVEAPNGKLWTMNWNYNEIGFEQLKKDDLIYWGKDGNRCPQKKVYLKPSGEMTKTFGSMLDAGKVGYTGHGGNTLTQLGIDKTKFIYAKPVALVQHFLEIATTKDSRVLDFFAGSGTTGHAVMSLNKIDGGTRSFVLCNEADICQTVTLPRVLAAQQMLGDESQIDFHTVEQINIDRMV